MSTKDDFIDESVFLKIHCLRYCKENEIEIADLILLMKKHGSVADWRWHSYFGYQSFCFKIRLIRNSLIVGKG